MHAGKEIGKGLLHQYSQEGWIEMTRDYLVVYEQGENNWSAFSPDLPGCGSLGDTLEETRTEMRAAMELYLIETAAAGEPIPAAQAGGVNFDEFDPNREAKQYVAEWLAVSLPKSATQAA
jgi:predicted RNase H-like HicB family nuclease